MVARAADPVTAYARRVVDGLAPAGRLVRLACERHLRDLEHGAARGIYFDAAAATHAIRFFGYLKHSKGEWAGLPVVLEPWQEFVVGSVFGWKRAEDGTRRFRTAYNEVPRKNGKSTVAAGVGLYLFVADDEPGAEVYCAATKRDQARIVWDEAARMVRRSRALKKRVGIFKSNMHVTGTASKFEPLSADSDTMDGLNIHGAIVDELHAHKDRGIVDVIESALGSRRQPLIFYITTAGFDRHSVCWEQHHYAEQVLEGLVEDDTFFAYVAGIDRCDDWSDPRVWAKANPNLGVSVKLQYLLDEAAKAKEMPGKQNAFRRLHLDEWTEQANRWIDLAVWDRCGAAVDAGALTGRRCFCGLDLASNTDIAAFLAVFPDGAGGFDLLARFWIPENSMRARVKRDRVPYDVWVRQGHIAATEGDVIDYDFIRADIGRFGEQYEVAEIAFDRWGALQVSTQLDGDGFTMVPFGQGFASMAGPTKELEKALLSGKIRHGGNPVLRWMASNVAVRQDPAGNLKPDKERSTEKIDGIVALIMGLGRATVAPPKKPSVYERRGLLSV